MITSISATVLSYSRTNINDKVAEYLMNRWMDEESIDTLELFADTFVVGYNSKMDISRKTLIEMIKEYFYDLKEMFCCVQYFFKKPEECAFFRNYKVA